MGALLLFLLLAAITYFTLLGIDGNDLPGFDGLDEEHEGEVYGDDEDFG